MKNKKRIIIQTLPSSAKPIPSLPNYYATPEGDIFKITTGAGNPNWGVGKSQILKLSQNTVSNSGYRLIQPYLNGNRQLKYVHHLIAETFLGLKPSDCEIDHIDRNKLNNNYLNLRYVTHKQNMKNTKERNIPATYIKNSNIQFLHETIIALRNENLPLQEIADILNVKLTLVYRIRDEASRWISENDKEKIISLHKKGLKAKKISKELNIRYNKVLYHIEKYKKTSSSYIYNK